MKRIKIASIMMILAMLIPMAVLIFPARASSVGFTYWVNLPQQLVSTSDYTMVPSSCTNDTLALRHWEWDDNHPVNVTFTVYNKGSNPITRVQIHIYEDANGAYFHALDATPPPVTWTTLKLEADLKGWHRLIEFDAHGSLDQIGTGDAKNFTITFGQSNGPVDETTPYLYRFVVTKVDIVKATDQYLYWFFDNAPPTVTITKPQNNEHVIGSLLPFCGHNYFTVNWQANDPSGLLYYNFTLVRTDDMLTWKDNSGPGSKVDTRTPLTTDNTLYTWGVSFTDLNFTDPLDGHYTVDVWVTDRVGNIGHDSIQFDYTHPQKPFWFTPTAGFAAIDTWWNSTTQIVESESKTFGNKTLGTTVTVGGYKFAPSTTVTITVRIPTYDYFSGVDYEVPVAKATTDSAGNFTASFIFPKAPKGVYNVTAWSSSTDIAYVTKCATSFTVSEKAIYKPLGDNPDVLIGPDVINVEATGFIAPNTVPETYSIYLLCNNKDALQGINQQVLWYWYFDGNGTLQNALTYSTGRFVENGIVWPSLQPGTYNLTLFLVSPGKWWNLDHWVNQTNDEYTNTVTVHETLSLLISIKDDTVYIRTAIDTINAKLDTLKPIVDRIDGNVVTINTTLGRIEATINQLSPVITRIDGNVVTINTVVGQINTTMATVGPQLAAIGPDIATIKTSVGTGLSGTVTSIKDDVATIKTDAGDVHAQLPNITNYIIVVIVLTLIAALAAIACVFLVFRKIA